MNWADFVDLVSGLTINITDAIHDASDGNLLLAFEDAIKFQQNVLEYLKSLQGLPQAVAFPNDFKNACSNLRSACLQAKTAPVLVAAPANKLFPGDGTFLKNLAEFVLKILPIIAPFFTPPPEQP